MGVLSKIAGFFINIFVLSWDFGLFILNILTPSLKPGHVVPPNAAGHNLTWPSYVPPRDGDSRSACPMLNAMANHGILPHDGKNITFKDLNTAVRHTFNFAPSFCFFVPKFSADFLNRSYWSGRFDLAELSLHNAIEHDASLTRQDAAIVPDQGKPDLELVNTLLKEATGEMPDGSPLLTIPDLSRALSKRRVDCRKTNDAYTENLFHNMFGSANSSTMLTIFGGRIDDLRPMLTEERFSEQWEPRVLSRFGLTMAKFNFTVLPVERGVKTKVAEH
ncbi:Cloroperoxidase [Acephala macrosclerotiorum]|nr:Cloroperoxidase [Acephala macrosclerotiorum]